MKKMGMNDSYNQLINPDYTNHNYPLTGTSINILTIDDEISVLRRTVENLLDTVTILKLEIAVLKNKITSEEKDNIIKMLAANDTSAIELAKTIIDELNI